MSDDPTASPLVSSSSSATCSSLSSSSLSFVAASTSYSPPLAQLAGLTIGDGGSNSNSNSNSNGGSISSHPSYSPSAAMSALHVSPRHPLLVHRVGATLPTPLPNSALVATLPCDAQTLKCVEAPLGRFDGRNSGSGGTGSAGSTGTATFALPQGEMCSADMVVLPAAARLRRSHSALGGSTARELVASSLLLDGSKRSASLAIAGAPLAVAGTPLYNNARASAGAIAAGPLRSSCGCASKLSGGANRSAATPSPPPPPPPLPSHQAVGPGIRHSLSASSLVDCAPRELPYGPIIAARASSAMSTVAVSTAAALLPNVVANAAAASSPPPQQSGASSSPRSSDRRADASAASSPSIAIVPRGLTTSASTDRLPIARALLASAANHPTPVPTSHHQSHAHNNHNHHQFHHHQVRHHQQQQQQQQQAHVSFAPALPVDSSAAWERSHAMPMGAQGVAHAAATATQQQRSHPTSPSVLLRRDSNLSVVASGAPLALPAQLSRRNSVDVISTDMLRRSMLLHQFPTLGALAVNLNGGGSTSAAAGAATASSVATLSSSTTSPSMSGAGSTSGSGASSTATTATGSPATSRAESRAFATPLAATHGRSPAVPLRSPRQMLQVDGAMFAIEM